jgi:hypothetical protein
MLQMTLHLTRSSRLWTFQLLGFEVFQVRLQKKATSTVSIEIHKGAIFDRLKNRYRSRAGNESFRPIESVPGLRSEQFRGGGDINFREITELFLKASVGLR